MAFVSSEFWLRERRACKVLRVERSSYRYEPTSDRNAGATKRAGEVGAAEAHSRLHALLSRRGHEVSVKRVYRLCLEEYLSVRRKTRKRLVRILSVMDAYTRECWSD